MTTDSEIVEAMAEAGRQNKGSIYTEMAAALAAATPLIEAGMLEWRPIAEAKKDGTPYLLRLRPDLVKTEARRDLEAWQGLAFVGRHPGLADDGFDIGWHFAAPVGQGGFPDDWMVGFITIPGMED